MLWFMLILLTNGIFASPIATVDHTTAEASDDASDDASDMSIEDINDYYQQQHQQQPVYPIVYRCVFDYTKGGICMASNTSYPDYSYKLYVDYSDRSLGIVANPINRGDIFPVFICELGGWLTIVDAIIVCKSKTNISFHCTGGTHFAVCVPEDI